MSTHMGRSLACLLWAVVLFRLLCPFTIVRPALIHTDVAEEISIVSEASDAKGLAISNVEENVADRVTSNAASEPTSNVANNTANNTANSFVNNAVNNPTGALEGDQAAQTSYGISTKKNTILKNAWLLRTILFSILG